MHEVSKIACSWREISWKSDQSLVMTLSNFVNVWSTLYRNEYSQEPLAKFPSCLNVYQMQIFESSLQYFFFLNSPCFVICVSARFKAYLCEESNPKNILLQVTSNVFRHNFLLSKNLGISHFQLERQKVVRKKRSCFHFLKKTEK